jgi:hypothetical protein
MTMLHKFLTENRAELIARCSSKVSKRATPPPTEGAEMKHGIPAFLEQLTRTLSSVDAEERRRISGPLEAGKTNASSEIGDTAASHGTELLTKGYTVDQVVHCYGDLCQSVTELAVEQRAAISSADFRTLNKCLDNAIAGAVTEFGLQRDQVISDDRIATSNERLGSIGHQLRGLVDSAILAVEVIKSGTVGISGATSAVLDSTLIRLRELVELSFADEMRATDKPRSPQKADRD